MNNIKARLRAFAAKVRRYRLAQELLYQGKHVAR